MKGKKEKKITGEPTIETSGGTLITTKCQKVTFKRVGLLSIGILDDARKRLKKKGANKGKKIGPGSGSKGESLD